MIDRIKVILLSFTGEVDYESIQSILSFELQTSHGPQCTDVRTISDTILEEDERFSVNLGSLHQNIHVNTTSINITIRDDDGRYCCVDGRYLLLLYTFHNKSHIKKSVGC